MPQYDTHLSCFGCRAKCKGQDPCAQGANATQCSACASLSQEQWAQLRETFNKRSAYRGRTGSQHEEETEELGPDFTGEELAPVDDSLLDTEPEFAGPLDLPTGISPLISNTASSIPAPEAGDPVQLPATSSSSTVDSSAFFKAPAPPPSSFFQPPTPGRIAVTDRMAALSLPRPTRIASAPSTEIPQTPKTLMLKSHLEQQNFELMNKLQEKNQEQFQSLSSQLQTGLQAFLEQSMKTMFDKLTPVQPQAPVPAPATAPTSAADPFITSVTPLQGLSSQTEEPMDSAPSQPQPPQVKKGLTKVKGSSNIAKQSLHAVASQISVPATTASASVPTSQAPLSTAPRLSSPLQTLEQEDYGTDTSSASFATSTKTEDTPDLGEQAAPPNLPFRACPEGQGIPGYS